MSVFEVYFICHLKGNSQVTHVVSVEVSATSTQEAIATAKLDVKYQYSNYTGFQVDKVVKIS